MRLIVGLGNPGPEYESTPHNLGFLTIDRLARQAGIRVTRKEAGALVGLGSLVDKEVVLAKPLSYMNSSGGPVRRLIEKYELNPSDLLLIYDELALPWLSMRLREQGSSAGHNGVESVIGSLKTSDFARLRLGIRPDHPIGNGARYVLSPFRRDELNELDELLDRATEVVRILLSDGAAKAMTVANRRAEGLDNEEA